MLKQRKSPSFFLGIIQRFFRREKLLSPELVVPMFHVDTTMNVQSEQEREEMAQLEAETLLRGGYTGEEIRAWALLRDRYQHGGSDRGPLFRHLQFLKLLVQTGKIER